MKTFKSRFILCLMLFFIISLTVQLLAVVPTSITNPYPANNATNVSTTLPQLSWQYIQGSSGAPTGYYVWLWDGNHWPTGFTFKFEMYGKLYFLANSPATFANARAACSAAGGKMASSFSGQMNTLLLNNAPTSTQCWLGGTDEVVENTYVWEDGQPWSYTNWSTGEPNGVTEDYIELFTSGTYSGKWNDVADGGTRNYFLEIPGRIIHAEIAGASSWDLNINLLPNHEYHWTIVPFNADGDGSSSTLTFTTGSAGTAPVAVSSITPVNDATNLALNPTLSWNSVSGAEYYKLYVFKDRGSPDVYGNTLIGVGNGHAYYKSDTAETWTTARDNCSSYGAYLATINSAEENSFLSGQGSCWIGMSDVTTEGDNRWVTGEPLNYSNWATGEPNGDAEDGMMIYNEGKWNDGSVASTLYYLIEYPGTILDGKIINGTSYSFRDVNLEPNTAYRWVVVPYNQYGRPWVTTFNSFTTGASGTAPGIISTITPTNAATGVAINAPLTWTAPTGSPTEYYAYLGTNNTCDFATNYTDLGFWNGHHYFRHTLYSCTWPQAEAYAELDGGLWSSTGTGYLATIGSANENAKLAEAGFGSSYARWFGGSDRVIPNIWKWSNGDPWAYTNWWTNEPNNASPGQYYTVINWGASGRWDDQNTTTSNLQYFLMETVPNLADGTRVLTNSYTPSLLRFNTTYYWSAVGSNNYGMANDTQRWSFTTADGKAVNPSPANAATGVYSQNFTWDDVAGASSYLFYLGTSNGNWNLVNAAPCATSGYSYGGTLDPSTQYYWKVATVTALETVQGNTWNFTTGALLNVNVTSNPAGAAILNNSTATGQVTDHVFPSAYGSSAFYTVQMTDYDWTLDPLYDSNVITNLSSAQHINFIGNYHHVDITGGFEYIGDPGIVISGTTGTVGDLTVLPTNQNGLDQATIMIFTGTVNSSLTVHVASGTWYVIAYYGGAWHQGNPYPCVGAGDVIFADIPFGAKADIPVIISEGDQTLPVELSSFTATLTAEYFVNLTWITQSETEMNGFVVYRSTNEALSDAIIVSNVIPATNTSQQTEYNYIDSEVEPNTTYYYWLQAIGLANTDTFHGPILVNVTDNGGVVPPPVIPVKTGIANIFPNPFNPHTEIAYSLKDEATVQIAVFNCKGQQIRSLVSDKKGSGFYRTGWDGKDAQGRDVSGGIYYVRMTADNARYTQKMILLK